MSKRGSGRRAFRLFATGLLVALVLSTVIVIAALGVGYSLDRASGLIPADGAEFTVAAGASAADIADRLATQGLVRSELLFRALLKLRRLESALKVGTYRVEPGMSGSDIMDMIAGGRQALVRLRIPEGSGLRALAQAAEAAGIASAADVTATAADPALAAELGLPPGAGLVGYLFPDTYLLARNSGADALLRLMVRTFRERLSAAVPEAAALDASALHERIILASIVEREYRVPEEAPLMAGVFWNRLRIGMALQSCATVVYVITERLGKPHPERLFDRDLEIKDPFNTYRYPGLPPAPICNPGIVAITAAIRPESTRYLYFRLVDEAAGRHYFSETLDEHIRAGSLAVKPRSP